MQLRPGKQFRRKDDEAGANAFRAKGRIGRDIIWHIRVRRSHSQDLTTASYAEAASISAQVRQMTQPDWKPREQLACPGRLSVKTVRSYLASIDPTDEAAGIFRFETLRPFAR